MHDVETLIGAIARLGGDGAGLAAVETRLDAGHGSPAHVHPEPEAFAVLEGSLELELGLRTVRLAAGESLVAPAGTRHVHRAGPEGARILTVTRTRSVSRYEDFLRAVMPADAEPSASELAALEALAAASGIDLDGR